MPKPVASGVGADNRNVFVNTIKDMLETMFDIKCTRISGGGKRFSSQHIPKCKFATLGEAVTRKKKRKIDSDSDSDE